MRKMKRTNIHTLCVHITRVLGVMGLFDRITTIHTANEVKGKLIDNNSDF